MLMEQREKVGYVTRLRGMVAFTEGDEETQRREEEMQKKRNAELVKLARISMDQAIQIATSKAPGKVLECSLVGERWSGQDELAKPGIVLYHVLILTGDEVNPVSVHVMVNASDGTIVTINNEGRKRENSEELRLKRSLEELSFERSTEKALNGGVLNGKASSLPRPSIRVLQSKPMYAGR